MTIGDDSKKTNSLQAITQELPKPQRLVPLSHNPLHMWPIPKPNTKTLTISTLNHPTIRPLQNYPHKNPTSILHTLIRNHLSKNLNYIPNYLVTVTKSDTDLLQPIKTKYKKKQEKGI